MPSSRYTKAIHAIVLSIAVSSSSAFTGPTALPRNMKSFQLQSSALPLPNTSTSTSNTSQNQKQQQQQKQNQMPKLDEDDLYVRNDKVPKVGEVMRMLPKETFDVNTAMGLFYFGVDFAAVAATMGFLNAVVTSDVYHSLPVVAQGLMVAPLQVLTGFAMWCMWCIGHDAGHSTVSKSKSINRVVGEIAHSAICLTPFVPWAKSHRQHHLNHNHITKDYSHQWFIKEEKEELFANSASWFKPAYETRVWQLPVLYMVYLLAGVPDGGHVFFYGRMWEGSDMKTKLDAAISVAVSMATAGSFWMNMGTADFTVVCMVPWLVMSFWLFMVTYLQHHSDDGKLYTDDTYTFERGAFETVDRDYGTWINRMSHHMMDGHVIHHLFFEKVPHYRLEDATKALVTGMEQRDQSHLYKTVKTPDFVQELVKRFDENWFFVSEKNVVREGGKK